MDLSPDMKRAIEAETRMTMEEIRGADVEDLDRLLSKRPGHTLALLDIHHPQLQGRGSVLLHRLIPGHRTAAALRRI